MSDVDPVVPNTDPITPNEPPKADPPEPGKQAPNPLLEKALKEKRNAMERVRELEAKNQEMLDQQLKEKEDFKSLYEASQSKLTELNTRLETEQKEKVDGFKTSALKKELTKMGADTNYADTLLQLADMDSLKYDDEHRIVLGAEDMAKSIKEKLPVAFGTTTVKVDQTAPVNNFSDVNLENYKSMDAKDRKNPDVKAQLFAKHGITLKK